MDVDLLFVPGCPNVDLARQRIRVASERAGVPVEVRERQVTDAAEAAGLGMRGSPTILVLGADVSRRVGADVGSVSSRRERAGRGRGRGSPAGCLCECGGWVQACDLQSEDGDALFLVHPGWGRVAP